MNHPGLDYAFLKYLGVSIDGEAALHGFYLPFLAGYARVLDLGCGLGGFVKLLCEQGIDAYGVDSDPQCIAQARTHNLPVIEADVVEYLRTAPPASHDAIFSAHLVEHMPYDAVLETIQLAHRALKPGGRLLLVTPNPRALITHLELYHLHFAHIALYHPKLLAFFMEYAGFARTEMGENPHTMPQHVSAESPLRGLTSGPSPKIGEGAGGEVLPRPKEPIRRALWYVKMGLAQWLVRPYFDQARRQLEEMAAEIVSLRANLNTTIEAINRPFECYVIGDKAQ
jgi:O-antigen chain-terminating methyltransferase